MNTAPGPGPALDPHETGRRHWWHDARWTRFVAAVDKGTRPRAEVVVPGAYVAPVGPGFPFTRPRHRDWLFWWAVTLAVVLLVGFAFDVTSRYGGFNLSAWLIDAAIGIPLVFMVLVLPVAGVRTFVRHQRKKLAASRAARA